MPPALQLLIPLVLIVAFFLLLIRPQRAQQRRVQELQSSLEVGQEVVLSAGIFGTIRSLSDTRVELEIAPGTVITVARQVVVRRAEQLPETAEIPEKTETTEDGPTDPEPGPPTRGDEQ